VLRRLAGIALVLCAGAFGVSACGSSDDEPAGGGGLKVDRFDSDAAWRLVKDQVEVGQRPAGSAQLRRLAVRLRRMLPEGRFEPVPGEPGVRNVVGTLPGTEESRDFYHSGLRGSRAYVKAHPGETADMVLLDYVGNKGLQLPREGTSSIALWNRLRSAARRVGAQRFFPDYSSEDIVDDHSPFLRSGVPSIDLIDWRYHGHELSDGLDKLSPASLDAVGETVTELAKQLRAPDSRP